MKLTETEIRALPKEQLYRARDYFWKMEESKPEYRALRDICFDEIAKRIRKHFSK